MLIDSKVKSKEAATEKKESTNLPLETLKIPPDIADKLPSRIDSHPLTGKPLLEVHPAKPASEFLSFIGALRAGAISNSTELMKSTPSLVQKTSNVDIANKLTNDKFTISPSGGHAIAAIKDIGFEFRVKAVKEGGVTEFAMSLKGKDVASFEIKPSKDADKKSENRHFAGWEESFLAKAVEAFAKSSTK